jgi:hypothetical protein
MQKTGAIVVCPDHYNDSISGQFDLLTRGGFLEATTAVPTRD